MHARLDHAHLEIELKEVIDFRAADRLHVALTALRHVAALPAVQTCQHTPDLQSKFS